VRTFNVPYYVTNYVTNPPAIALHPQDQTVVQGANATFSVTATGTTPLAYQWRLAANNIPGATASTYTRNNAQPADAGSYSVVVTNIAGTLTSADALLTVNVPPAITSQPTGQTVVAGQSASFSVTATGTAPLSYQWRLNGTPIAGATVSSYTRNNAQPADAGSYSVVITNVASSVTSSDAVLTVNVPPAITLQPQPATQSVTTGQSATFTVTASGTAPLSYQWRFNGTPIPAATDSSYTRSDAQPADAGSYSVIVTNVAGSVTSADATLAVNVPPVITDHPQDNAVHQGADAAFTVAASGTAPLAYQWYFGGLPLAGATDSAFTVTSAHPTNAGIYAVEVLNVAGQVTSSNATLTVNLPPEITAQPQGLTVAVGSNATFTVTATGTAPLAYQWRFNGTNLAYATASAYTCSNAQATHAGSYSVLVSNVAGSVVSADALLTVTLPSPPQITDIVLTPGGQIQLQISAPPGHYGVDATTNLVVVDWVELTNFTTTGDAFQYLDSETGLTQRFYRVRVVP
jgi:hypothetical protein